MNLHWLFGEVGLKFKNEDKQKVFLVISMIDTPFRKLEYGKEYFSIRIPLIYYKSMRSVCESEALTFEKTKVFGIPSLIYRYRKRVGLLLGFLLASAMIWLSGKVIWCVRVEGNSTVPDKEIIDTLESLGCGVGDMYENIDFDRLHNSFLMECKDIAWIAVNMNGNHANVEVRETEKGEKEEEGGFYNIIASESGQIERIAEIEGKPVIQRFDTVVKGELLISGAISYKQETQSRFESAAGSVFAKVNRSFEVKVPVNREVRVYTGDKREENTVRFFKLRINLFRKCGISYELCDKITVYKQIHLFDTVPLPLYLHKTVYSEYSLKNTVLTEKEVRDLAIAEYRRRLTEVLGDAELISKSVTEDFDGEYFTVNCEIYCLADIAKKVPLVIEENKDRETEK